MGNKNVLVTGGAGYIGSHACLSLREAGYNPITIDNLSSGWREAVKFGPFVHVDLRKKPDIDQVFKEYEPIAVMHFAAFSQVGESVKEPGLYWENNTFGSLNLFQSAVEHGCLKFLLSSTCAIYGDQDSIILDETSLQYPSTPYASSKYATEKMLEDFQRTYNLNYIIFRYFNVAGADPGCRIGEFHKPETHLIPLIIEAVSGKRDYLTVFGTDYDTPDGTCIRDYVHVCDLIDAHISGLKWLEEGYVSRVFNLGSGHGFSVRQIIDQVENITGKRVPIFESERRLGDCAKLVASPNRARKELKWSADRSNLRQMIMDAQRWHMLGGFNT